MIETITAYPTIGILGMLQRSAIVSPLEAKFSWYLFKPVYDGLIMELAKVDRKKYSQFSNDTVNLSRDRG